MIRKRPVWNIVFSVRRPVRSSAVATTALCILLFSPSACSVVRSGTPVKLRPAGAVRQPDHADWSEYSVVLSMIVKPRGVDYEPLLADCSTLDRFLTGLANFGPETHPQEFTSPESRAAFWINAYNAAVVRSNIAGIEHMRRNRNDWRRRSFTPEHWHTFTIDNCLLTPSTMRLRAERTMPDDWRIGFALCNGQRPGYALARRPYTATALDSQLNSAVARAIADPDVVLVNHAEQVIEVHSDIMALSTRLVDEYQKRSGARRATLFEALLDLASPEARRSLNSGVGYPIVRMSHATVINQVPLEE